jgi:hypothetical protein
MITPPSHSDQHCDGKGKASYHRYEANEGSWYGERAELVDCGYLGDAVLYGTDDDGAQTNHKQKNDTDNGCPESAGRNLDRPALPGDRGRSLYPNGATPR